MSWELGSPCRIGGRLPRVMRPLALAGNVRNDQHTFRKVLGKIKVEEETKVLKVMSKVTKVQDLMGADCALVPRKAMVKAMVNALKTLGIIIFQLDPPEICGKAKYKPSVIQQKIW